LAGAKLAYSKEINSGLQNGEKYGEKTIVDSIFFTWTDI